MTLSSVPSIALRVDLMEQGRLDFARRLNEKEERTAALLYDSPDADPEESRLLKRGKETLGARYPQRQYGRGLDYDGGSRSRCRNQRIHRRAVRAKSGV